MSKISETDLILNPDGSIYHLNISPKQITDTIIAVGDPSRVYKVSEHFDEVEFEMNRREFITHVGNYKGKKITVISTGIGTDNIELFFTELDALFNMDFKTREPKARKKKIRVIRIGTSGSLQEDIPVGAHLVTDYAIGLDNLMNFYDFPMDEFEQTITSDLQKTIGLPFTPYMAKASSALKEQIAYDMISGNTITAPGFYAPQGRIIRLPIKYPRLLDDLNRYHYNTHNFWLTNFEMETAGYYAMARLFGHEALSVNAIIANRIKNKFAADPEKVVQALILTVLNRL